MSTFTFNFMAIKVWHYWVQICSDPSHTSSAFHQQKVPIHHPGQEHDLLIWKWHDKIQKIFGANANSFWWENNASLKCRINHSSGIMNNDSLAKSLRLDHWSHDYVAGGEFESFLISKLLYYVSQNDYLEFVAQNLIFTWYWVVKMKYLAIEALTHPCLYLQY